MQYYISDGIVFWLPLYKEVETLWFTKWRGRDSYYNIDPDISGEEICLCIKINLLKVSFLILPNISVVV